MRTAKAQSFSINAPKGGLVIHADGETICTDGHSVEITCLPACIEVFYSPELALRREAEWEGRR